MSQETREERIKRLMREREEGTLAENPAPARIEEKPVEPEEQQDWEEESRIISAKNRERIKKNAELAAAQAKAATQFAEKGARSAVKSLQAFKEKTEVKIQAEKEKRRLKRDKQETIKGADLEVLATKSSRESSAESRSAQRQTRTKFWMLCSIPIALSIVLVGAWLFKTNMDSERVKPVTVKQVKTDQPATAQVLAPVQAVLPTVEEPPQELPPLPQEPQESYEEGLDLEVPAAVAEKRPEVKRPIVKGERAAKEKAVENKPESAKSEWQKDAAQKLKDYQF
ncbi:hypothetical protein U4I36_12805 [Stenotrophomonas maltophilia]|uniref:hypothetical protein n=1 Tax=Stenotrophomonas maltophilia TaxID=40324 RepID=UPI000B0AD6A4|nr:hypothetical protein [Stenotrophomonas maltophilia]MBH1417676.1 hypothetical protein [Stenotrophomonas maltophilia]MBH1813579.1 hypothetical protein [Stenotrophomonas maltophilia]MBH1822632.1 hypothetical protein [Stenotrophomonas maltophilia]MDZ5805095.1 hypothetical protein [Stenotrophomonas maltophilia]HEL3634796.1 hypothetical protein [Stenotrophomonas maltophilia]